ncbi:hypothetical protein Hanom_Chr14g01293551 [Helianthus anomalus]
MQPSKILTYRLRTPNITPFLFSSALSFFDQACSHTSAEFLQKRCSFVFLKRLTSLRIDHKCL